MTSPSGCSHLTSTRKGHSPFGRLSRETLFRGEWRVLSLRALLPRYRAGGNCPPPGPGALAQPGGRSCLWPCRIAACVYRLHSHTVHTPLCTPKLVFTFVHFVHVQYQQLLLEHSSNLPSAFSFQLTAFSL